MRASDELLAAVYADPDDVALRRVLGDALSAQGDPRGEFISLQTLGRPLSAAEAERALALQRAHQDEWLGSLGEVLAPWSVRFEHGFPASATIQPKVPEDLMPLVGDHRWATFRALRVADLGRPSYIAMQSHPYIAKIVLNRSMRSLRELTGVLSPELVLELCAGPVDWPIEVLEVQRPWDHVHGEHPQPEDVFDRPLSLPQLKHLILNDSQNGAPEDYDWLFQGIGASLEGMTLPGRSLDLPSWYHTLMNSTLRRLSVFDRRLRLRTTLRRDAARPEIDFEGDPRNSDLIEMHVPLALHSLPAGSISAIRVSGLASWDADRFSAAANHLNLESLEFV